MCHRNHYIWENYGTDFHQAFFKSYRSRPYRVKKDINQNLPKLTNFIRGKIKLYTEYFYI